MEKCEDLYSSNETDKQEYCTEEKTMRSTNVIANVGLMYPSDYVYTYSNGVDNTCYTDGFNYMTGDPGAGWLFNRGYQWTISTFLQRSSQAFYVSLGVNCGIVNSSYAVRPCVYLRSDIEITGGDGSSVENAYTLKVPTNE